MNRWWERVEGELVVVLDVHEKAVSKERPRTSAKGVVYTPAKTRKFEKMIASSSKVTNPVTYPLKLSVTIWEAPPKTWAPEKRQLALEGLIVPTRGDLDNQVKAITDGLNGVAYLDDAQITRLDAQRQYGKQNRILVTMTQQALSPVQLDHAVTSLRTLLNGEGQAS